MSDSPIPTQEQALEATLIAGPCCPGKEKIQSLVVGGHEVGLAGLDGVLEAVRSACPTTIAEARQLVLALLRQSNYIPGNAEVQYVDAVLAELLRRFPHCAGLIEGLDMER